MDAAIPADWDRNSFQVGLKARFDVQANPELVQFFSNLSQDFNPLHNDRIFATSLGYKDIVAHGALQQAFVSRMIGMHLPGRHSIIHRLTSQYSMPVIVGEALAVEGEVVAWKPREALGKVRVTIRNSLGQLVSLTEVDIGMTGLEGAAPKAPCVDMLPETNTDIPLDGLGPILIVGASSGLAKVVFAGNSWNGRRIIKLARSGDFDILEDFEAWTFDRWDAMLREKDPFAVVVFASLPPVKARASDLDLESFARNAYLHLAPLQACARSVRGNSGGRLKRIVSMGSYGSRHLGSERGYEGYSYAKMVASYYCRDLAIELASFGTTVNIIAPAELPIGMNIGLSEKTIALIKAKSPTREMVSIRQVEAAMRWLLSEDASFVSGQELVIAGGRS